jgi:hypothetical protein
VKWTVGRRWGREECCARDRCARECCARDRCARDRCAREGARDRPHGARLGDWGYLLSERPGVHLIPHGPMFRASETFPEREAQRSPGQVRASLRTRAPPWVTHAPHPSTERNASMYVGGLPRPKGAAVRLSVTRPPLRTRSTAPHRNTAEDGTQPRDDCGLDDAPTEITSHARPLKGWRMGSCAEAASEEPDSPLSKLRGVLWRYHDIRERITCS